MHPDYLDYSGSLDYLTQKGITYEMITIDPTHQSPHYTLQFYMKFGDISLKAAPMNSINLVMKNITSTYEDLPHNLVNYSKATFVIDTDEIESIHEHIDELNDRCGELEDECNALMTQKEYSDDYSDRYNDLKSEL